MSNFFSRVKNQSSLVFSNIAAAAIHGFFWIYLAKILDKAEYGELGYLLSIASLGASIALVGLPTMIVVYGSKKENVLSPAYTLGLITSSITSIVSYLITQNFVISILIIGLVLFGLMESELNSKKRFLAYSVNNISRRILLVVFALILYPVFGINGVLFGIFLSMLSGFIGLYNFLRNKKISISTLKLKIRFLINDYFSSLSSTVLFTGDKLIIGTLAGFSLLGNYQLAIQPLSVLQVIPSALMVYLMPLESQGMKNKKFKIYSVGLMCILTIISIALIPYAVDRFLPVYKEAIIPMQIIIVSVIPTTINMIFSAEFYANERSKIVLISSIIQVGLYFILIPLLGTSWLGLTGIAISYLVSVIAISIFNIMVKKQLFFKSYNN